ncbi:MAG: hypothetical protein ACREOZ_04330, partial [Gloeomargaritales cyanobacterium]
LVLCDLSRLVFDSLRQIKTIIMNMNNIQLANTWLTHFAARSDNELVNQGLESFNDKLKHRKSEVACVNEFPKDENIFLLSVSAHKENLQLFHHTTMLGGTYANPKQCFVTLIGLGSEATAVEVKPSEIFKPTSTQTPKWDQFLEHATA